MQLSVPTLQILSCPAWAWEHCRISPCHKKRLNQTSFVLLYFLLFAFYRAMHFSAKRGIAIACRLSVCLQPALSITVGNLLISMTLCCTKTDIDDLYDLYFHLLVAIPV